MSFEPILILYAFLAVVQLILTMLPGVWYTRKGTVNGGMRRALSGMAFNLMLPAVAFINIAGQVTADTIVGYWPFAMNTCVSTLVGMGLGWVVNEVVGTPRHLRYHVVAACGYGNLNSAVVQIFGYPMAKWLLRRRVAPRSFVEVLHDMSTVSLKGMPRPPSIKEGELPEAAEEDKALNGAEAGSGAAARKGGGGGKGGGAEAGSSGDLPIQRKARLRKTWQQ
ncbi:hypothetical protein CHLNCDRAFT_136993 [Chlorella variabilis]|uniref:Uncharacterized protein n=1 Tax=Chlorella variabilis TaxID=554065 RepID=E1ZLR8_CHLVA|nr:hypothetical protein CHLNCDRAFT_136993 [Chlorella variabilis]EFN53312.1 hypothetical protein CHLNCDRAFT_136993 [Chlorella variabilis]|eukprot:XP_005845414.1 hypothetical protein CHLNCDRAFT_136993 [Chlorella variabilis]